MSKIKIILLSLFITSKAHAIMPYSIFNPEARIEVLSEERYQSMRDEIKQEEKAFLLELENAADEKTAHLAFCLMNEHKLERFALASANLQHEIAHQDFIDLHREIQLTLQSKEGMRYPCY